MQQFSQNCGRMMLFMQSLRCIRISHILGDSSAATPLSQVHNSVTTKKGLLMLNMFSSLYFSWHRSMAQDMRYTNATHLLVQVSLLPHDRDARVVFEDKDWRHKSLGQLVRGHRFPGIRKTLSFSVVTTSGVQSAHVHMYVAHVRAKYLVVVFNAVGITKTMTHVTKLARTTESTVGAGDNGDVAQELWLVCANAGLGAARDLAVDRRYAALELEPTAAIAVCFDSTKSPSVLPAGGGILPSLNCTKFYSVTHWDVVRNGQTLFSTNVNFSTRPRVMREAVWCEKVLFAPLPLHLGHPVYPAASIEGKLPFLVYGAFAVSSSGGRHIAGTYSGHQPPTSSEVLLLFILTESIERAVVLARSAEHGLMLGRRVHSRHRKCLLPSTQTSWPQAWSVPGWRRSQPCKAATGFLAARPSGPALASMPWCPVGSVATKSSSRRRT